jgi:exonuclease SbcD
MRILHLADVHLDTSFQGRSSRIRTRLRGATREAFRSAVELALDAEVHAVVIAGDLFDGLRLSFETERFLLEQLQRLTQAGIGVVYATGNHDPGSTRHARREIPWPAGVEVVPDGRPRRIAIRDGKGHEVGCVTAAGHATSQETGDLAAGFPRPDGALPEVAVLHTQVVGSRSAEAHEPYAPSTLETLVGSGYDYWALGHVHVRQELGDLPGIHYSGNLQGRTPRETGPKGALLVEVARGFAPQVEFRPLAPVRWESVLLDHPVEARSVDGLIRLVRDRWREARREDPDPGAEWMVRVSIRGATPLWRDLADEDDRAHLGSELEGVLGALEVQLEVEGLHAPVVVDEHRGREDVLGAALALVEGLRGGTEELPGLDDELAGLGEIRERQAYLERLLDGAEGEIVSRLVKEKE